MTPIQMLAIALAYMIETDKVHENEERAALLATFGKMVTRGEMSQPRLSGLIQFAFDYIKEHDIDAFLAEAAPALAPLQRVAIYVNALDMMLMDGKVIEAEQGLLKKIQDAFALAPETVLAIREVLLVKNDTRMFLHPEHPRNSNTAVLRVSYWSARTE